MKGFIVGKTENNKKDLKIVPYDTECIFQPLGSDIWERHGHVLDRKVVQGRVVTDFIPIPCGQCIGCRLDYSKQWATRCMLESEYHDENYFITLTYDDKHLAPLIGEYVDEDTGEILNNTGSLCKKDLQDFIKRLRRHFDYRDQSGFRYYACGEYGSKSARPHFHMIAFGLHLDDLKLYKSTSIGNYYTSELLSRKWQNGYVIIGSVTYESCAYVSRYIMKKQKGKNSDVYDYYNIDPEFTVMSRNPGIASDYFRDNYESIYSIDNIVLSGGVLCKPPRYFDNLMNDLDEELMQSVREKRVDIAEKIQAFKANLSTADYQMQLQHAENNKAAQIKKLVRPLD